MKWKWKSPSRISEWPHGLYSPWNCPDQNTGVSSLSLLQGIFPAQGSNSGLPHYRRILYQLSHKGSPEMIDDLGNHDSVGPGFGISVFDKLMTELLSWEASQFAHSLLTEVPPIFRQVGSHHRGAESSRLVTWVRGADLPMWLTNPFTLPGPSHSTQIDQLVCNCQILFTPAVTEPGVPPCQSQFS